MSLDTLLPIDPSPLESGPEFAFRDWPNPLVPRLGAGVYTVWRGQTLVYVGMTGRGLSTVHVAAHRDSGERGKGLYLRLSSHASGRRSGDQFCVYVCDRLVLPELAPELMPRIAAGEISLDRLTRDYIRSYLGYRFMEMPDGPTAAAVEDALRGGALSAGSPLLNPKSSARPRL